jgi:hypothetical protein
VSARGALAGVVIGQLVIFACWKYTALAFLWYNVIGCGVVVVSAVAISALLPDVTLAKSEAAPIPSE